MARKAKEQSAKAKAAEAANLAVTKAKEAHGKAANENNLKAYKSAKERADAANKELAREKFETIAGGRMTTVLTAINALAKCANRKAYDFEEPDVAKIKTALADATKSCADDFEGALKGGGGPAKTEKFTF
jgi:hypothetical protein